MENWFDLISWNDELEQGDILPKVAMFFPDISKPWPTEAGVMPHLSPYMGPAIVLTQSCDIAHGTPRTPADLVLMGLVQTLTDLQRNSKFSRSDVLNAIRQGNYRRFFLLDRLPKDSYWEGQAVVDFHRISQVSRLHLEDIAKQLENRPRLKSPMRESLGAAMGDTFSRVAIDPRFEIPPFPDGPQTPRKATQSEVIKLMEMMDEDQRVTLENAIVADSPKFQGISAANKQNSQKVKDLKSQLKACQELLAD